MYTLNPSSIEVPYASPAPTKKSPQNGKNCGVDLSNSEVYGKYGSAQEYHTLKDFSTQFRAQYTSAVIDLAEWANSRKEKEISIDSHLSGVLRDSYQNVTSLMRVLETDRKGVYGILNSNDEVMSRIQNNREQNYLPTKTISEIVGGFDTEEGKRVFFKSQSTNYFGITEADKLAKQLYTKRVFEELGQDKELTAYALGVTTKTIDNKLKEYEESVENKKVIPFERWDKDIKPNLGLIQYYQEKQSAENTLKEKPKAEQSVDDLIKTVPKPANGKVYKFNKKLREQGAKRAPKPQVDLEE